MPTKQSETKRTQLPDLDWFLDANDVDRDAVAQMRRRFLVVAPVNDKLHGGKKEPFICLFTNRREPLDEAYRACFSAVELTISFERWVSRFRPAVGYRIGKTRKDADFEAIETVFPRSDEHAREGDPLTRNNLLMAWAAARCRHLDEALQRPHVGGQFLSAPENEQGRQVFEEVRASLRAFCAFAPRLPELHAAFSRLLSQCANQNDLPPYASLAALPRGLITLVTETLLAEDESACVALDRLVLEGGWRTLTAQGKETLKCVIMAFRDAAIGKPEQHFNELQFHRGFLGRLAHEAITEELRGEFQKARAAHNRLKQILRNKALVAMILRSVLLSFYRLDPVLEIDEREEHLRDVTVERLIREGAPGLVAAPERRPQLRDRRRLAEELGKHLEQLVDYLLAAEDQRARAALPSELLVLARELAAEADLVASLREICVPRQDEDDRRARRAFLTACQTLIEDVLCPALYRLPVLSPLGLAEMLASDLQASFFTAVLLAERDQEAMREIAEVHYPFFQRELERNDQRLPENLAPIEVPLLASFFRKVTERELAEEIAGYGRVLQVVHRPLFRAAREGMSARPFLPSSSHDPRPHERWTDASGREEIDVDPECERLSLEGALQLMAARKDSGPEGQQAPSDDEIEGPRMELLRKALVVAGQSPDVVKEKQANRSLAALRKATELVLTGEDYEPLRQEVRRHLVMHEKGLALIFWNYQRNPEKRLFRQRVERMVLEGLMLQEWKQLGLGEKSSNLYLLLLDLVLHMDPEHPEEFLRQHSFTRYLDLESLKPGWVTELRQTLEIQASKSFKNVVRFVSEVRGIQYLMDKLAGVEDAELIFVNATAEEFLAWVTFDNRTPNQGRARMQAGRLNKSRLSRGAIHPALIYVSHTAFGERPPAQWLAQFKALTLAKKNLGVIPAPILLSMDPQDVGGEFVRQGKEWVAAGAGASAPVYVAGPSPRLNPADDGFPTFLPAGYVVMAHLLGGQIGDLERQSLCLEELDRLAMLGTGFGPFSDSIEGMVTGRIGLESDYFLFLLLNLYATAFFNGRRELRFEQFLENFDPDRSDRQRHITSCKLIEPLLLRPREAPAFARAVDSTLSVQREAEPYVPLARSAWFQRAARSLGYTT